MFFLQIIKVQKNKFLYIHIFFVCVQTNDIIFPSYI